MDYIANVENSEIDVSGIRTVLVQGDSSYPVIRFVLDPSLTGLSWRVRGTYTDTNIAVLSPKITPTESTTAVTLDWSVSSDFTTYDGDMQLVLVGANDLGTTVVKALADIAIQKDWSIGTTGTITLNLFEQLMAQLSSTALKLDQTTPQTITGGIPKLASTRVIDENNEMVDKKFVDDSISTHNTDAGAHADLGIVDAGGYYDATTVEGALQEVGADIGAIQVDIIELQNTGVDTTARADIAEIADVITDEINYTFAQLAAFTLKAYIDLAGVLQNTSVWQCSPYIRVSSGDEITVKLTTYSHTSAIAYFDINKNFISGVSGATWSWGTTLYPLNGTFVVPNGVFFVRFSVFTPEYANEQSIILHRSVVRDVETRVTAIEGQGLNLLVLGDSYSASNHWLDSMQDVVTVNNTVNLSAVSATIKDKYSDRTTYPYTDRTPTNDGGNLNTLGSQIQKLKRLMLGVDLDSGETQLYELESDYPNVIIIEGGMNDAPDVPSVVATYYTQFLVPVTAYYKSSAAAQVVQQTVFVEPPIDAIDRTCFAGAYRFLYDELFTLFPNAQIFITTASHMNYFTTDPNITYGAVADQQRQCANMLSCAVIDWHAEGNLNTVMIGLNGSGTNEDPYTPVGGDAYTSDKLHPNQNGGKRYGRLAGKVIAQKYLGLS